MSISLRTIFIQAALVFTIALSPARAQEAGRIHGIVTDRSTGEGLAGVNVMLAGTVIGAATDLDGSYVLTRILPGVYALRVSAIGYATTVIKDVAILPGAAIELSVSLTEEAYNLNEIVVSADELRSTESAIISQRKRSSSISDGISAEQIRRSPDATSGDALRRVTGLSIVENKFVIIRGITDRYNRTTIDGAAVTSTEAGKKSFSFDLLPANLLDNTSVIKSATPDLPGDFSGGLVQLNTLDFPAERTLKINLASSYNDLTTSKGFLATQGGKRDWLGFDDGTRAYPGDQPDANTIARKSANTWAPAPTKAPYNESFSVAAGDRIDFSEDRPGENRLGYVAALSYRNAHQRNDNLIDDAVTSRHYSGTSDDYSVLWGALANVSYKFGGQNTISFKNNYNRSALGEVIQYHGIDESIPLENTYTIIDWTQRSTYTGQLVGDHAFPALGVWCCNGGAPSPRRAGRTRIEKR